MQLDPVVGPAGCGRRLDAGVDRRGRERGSGPLSQCENGLSGATRSTTRDRSCRLGASRWASRWPRGAVKTLSIWPARGAEAGTAEIADSDVPDRERTIDETGVDRDIAHDDVLDDELLRGELDRVAVGERRRIREVPAGEQLGHGPELDEIEPVGDEVRLKEALARAGVDVAPGEPAGERGIADRSLHRIRR